MTKKPTVALLVAGTLIAGLFVLPAASAALVCLPVACAGPGGGDNEGEGKCDTIGTACAAAASVALDGCVSAFVDADGIAVAFIGIFPLGAAAHAEATITTCMSVGSAQAISAMTQLPGKMDNFVIAHEPGTPTAFNDNERVCVNAPLAQSFCGPTGTTYTNSNEATCVRAYADAAAGGQVGAKIPIVVGSLGTVGHAGAWADALSASCNAQDIIADLLDSPSQASVLPEVTPFWALNETLQAGVIEVLMDEVRHRTAQIQEQIVAQGGSDMEEMAAQLAEALEQDVQSALETMG